MIDQEAVRERVRERVREEIKKQMNAPQLDEGVGRWLKNSVGSHHGAIGVYQKGNATLAVIESKKGFEVIDIRIRNDVLRGTWHKQTFTSAAAAHNALVADGFKQVDDATRNRILNKRGIWNQITAAIGGASMALALM